ncbi:hypothetical protein AgCh_030519 [Apium graveolens]
MGRFLVSYQYWKKFIFLEVTTRNSAYDITPLTSARNVTDVKSNFNIGRFKTDVKGIVRHRLNTYGTVQAISLTLIESLSSLVIMGNIIEFERAVYWLADNLAFDVDVRVNVFEEAFRLIKVVFGAPLKLQTKLQAVTMNMGLAKFPYSKSSPKGLSNRSFQREKGGNPCLASPIHFPSWAVLQIMCLPL